MDSMILANGDVKQPTLVLALKSKKRIGVVQASNIIYKDCFNAASELSFRVYKLEDEENALWDELKDFRLIWFKEIDKWFEISVEVDEENETVKNILGVSVCESELSQINLYNIEINTETDILRDDYVLPTVLYNEEYPEASLLNRIMEKAPHYTITHVDSTIKNIQRTFSFDDTTIYDAMQQIAEEIGCIFIFDSGSSDGFISRKIYVYDLESNCQNSSCKHRGEFSNQCPECNGTNILYGYGNDTKIFVSTENLAEQITYKTNDDAVKNCFMVEGGDDLITSTVRNCNPNGTNYIWYFSQTLKTDMSDALIEKLNTYDTQYKYYRDTYPINLNQASISAYNDLVDKYTTSTNVFTKITGSLIGYSALMNKYYDTIDFALYLQSTMMPGITITPTTAALEAAKITRSALNPVAVLGTAYNYLSKATANNAILTVARLLITSGYRLTVETSSLSNKTWTGQLRVTSYSDDTDTALTNNLSITITNSEEKYVKQKILKSTTQDSTDALDVVSLFELGYSAFCTELKKHCLANLVSINDACEAILNILVEQGTATEENTLYDTLYLPYYQKHSAIQDEIVVRQNEINTICGTYDVYNNLVVKGLQNYIEEKQLYIQNLLDFKAYLGTTLWLEFCSYRRDDTYSNSNYVSDGLNNVELFDKARELLEVATKELYKSAELQHTISSSLNNLLAMSEFSGLLNNFEVGNWIHLLVDNNVFRLRLSEIEIDYDSPSNISVEFTDIIKSREGISDIQSVMDKASSIATSYDAVAKQASQGANTGKLMAEWVKKGLDLTTMKIVNNADNQEVVQDRNGLLLKEYFPVTDSYSDKQTKLINKGIYFTNDNWLTSKAAVGNFYYYDPVTRTTQEGYGVIAETIVSNIILSSDVGIYTDNNNITINEDGIYVVNSNGYLAKAVIAASSTNKITVLSSEANNFAVGNIVSIGSSAVNNDVAKNVTISAIRKVQILQQSQYGLHIQKPGTGGTLADDTSVSVIMYNGEITFSQFTTSNAGHVYSLGTYTLAAGSYKLTGCPTNLGTVDNTYISVTGTNVSANDTGSGVTFTLSAQTQVSINIKFDALDGKTEYTFIPFLRLLEDASLSSAYSHITFSGNPVNISVGDIMAINTVSVSIDPSNTKGVFVIESSKEGNVMWVDSDGNGHYSGAISIADGNFTVNKDGEINVRDVFTVDKYGTGFFQGSLSAANNTFSVNGTTGTLSAGGGKFVVDGATGSVTTSGSVILGGSIVLNGSITWGNNSPVKYQFSVDGTSWHDTMTSSDYYRRDSTDGGVTWGTPYQFRGRDGQDGQDGEDGDANLPPYIQSTYIDSVEIRSPTIMANDFKVYSNSSGGSYNMYGYYNSSYYHVFQISYYAGTSPTVTFSGGTGQAYAYWNFPYTAFSGNISFSSANVSGLAATFG